MESNAMITALGNLIHDPMLKQVGNSDVCNFTVAVNVSKNEDGSYNSNLYDCSIWNESGRFYYNKLQKGSQVVFNGGLEIVERKNKEGKLVTRMRVDIDHIRITNGVRGRTEPKPEGPVIKTGEPTNDEASNTEDLTE